MGNTGTSIDGVANRTRVRQANTDERQETGFQAFGTGGFGCAGSPLDQGGGCSPAVAVSRGSSKHPAPRRRASIVREKDLLQLSPARREML